MKHELQHDLYIPQPIWVLAVNLGYMIAIKEEDPNMWVDLTIANMQATLMLFVYERKQFLKGLDNDDHSNR